MISMSKRKMTGSKNHPLAVGLVLLAVLLLASCNREDYLPDGSDGVLPALGLNTLQAKDLNEAPTRVVTTSAYPANKFIGFFVKENTANGYTACNNRKGEYNTTRKLWLPVPDSIWLNNHDADIAVYAPYDAAQTTAANLKLAACLRPADGSKDVWCKKFTANNKSTNLAPVLEHVYTRFTINLSLDADYKGTAPVDSVSLANDSLYVSGAFRPFEATSYKHEGKPGVGFKLSPAKTLTTAVSTAAIDLLLIPATLTGDIKLSVQVNGIMFGVTLAASRFSGKLEAGKQYNANIKLKPTALEVTSVTINDWNDVTVSGEKDPVFVDPAPIDLGLDFVIAPANVIAIKLSDGTYAYDFAEEQGYYTGVEGEIYDPSLMKGDYFAWNTLDPAVTINIDVWDDANDVCRKIDDGMWYTPTKDQLQKFIDMYTNEKTIWGTYTLSNKTTVSGRYFGTAVLPSLTDKDKYVFLPAGGYPQGTVWKLVGSYGFYWSSTSQGSNAYDFRFTNSECSFYGDYYRANRRFVRCVKDKPTP